MKKKTVSQCSRLNSIFALIPGDIYIKNVYEFFPSDLQTVQQQLNKKDPTLSYFLFESPAPRDYFAVACGRHSP